MNQELAAPSVAARAAEAPPSELPWYRILVELFGWPLFGLFLFSLAARYVFLAELVNNFRMQLLVGVTLGALSAIGVRARWLTLALGFAGLWLGSTLVWNYLPANQPTAGNESIRIMSFNVLATTDDQQQVIDRIQEYDPDVLIVLEYNQGWHRRLKSIHDDYPYLHPETRWHGYGVAIFSKRPLLEANTNQLIADTTDSPMIVTEIDVGDARLRLAAIHVVSPTSEPRMKLRNEQFVEIAAALESSAVPTLVIGDFNCTPWSPFLRDFCHETGYRDTRQGFGVQATWPAQFWPAMIPIDHAFASDDVYVHRRQVGAATDSDHLPIILDVSVASDKTAGTSR